MSRVDTNFSTPERTELLDEVKGELPAFLSSATAERVEVLEDVSALLNLSAGDLRRVVAVHLGLTDEVREFCGALPSALRRPVTESAPALSATKEIRGSIDWAETTRLRGQGGLTGDFVVRSPRRVFDTPENQALSYALERLDAELRHAAAAGRDRKAGTHNGSWLQEIADEAARVRTARRHHWLRGVAPARPTDRVRRRLAAARIRFYKVLVPAVLAAIGRYTENPSADDLVELLSQRYFEPERDWQLFELVVALRLAKAFHARSAGKRKARLMVGTGRSPYARYVMPDGAEVWLWYQAWPEDAGASAYADALSRYAIRGGASRPDLIAQKRRGGEPVDTVVLELKASRSSTYLATGLVQLLGYLRDRPSTLQSSPAGWLVAPASSAFSTAPHGGSALWALDSDAVAGELVTRFGY